MLKRASARQVYIGDVRSTPLETGIRENSATGGGLEPGHATSMYGVRLTVVPQPSGGSLAVARRHLATAAAHAREQCTF